MHEFQKYTGHFFVEMGGMMAILVTRYGKRRNIIMVSRFLAP